MISQGFSPEALTVIHKKPMARYADFTAGNRMMWAHLPNRDSPYWIYFDKEPGLTIKPDVMCRWEEVPNYYPADYFKAAIFDPPHTWFGESSIHNDPTGKQGRWWGNPKNRATLLRDILTGQKAFSKVVNGPLLLKWNETSLGLERVLSLFTEWREVNRWPIHSPMQRGSSDTWWVRLVRK